MKSFSFELQLCKFFFISRSAQQKITEAEKTKEFKKLRSDSDGDEAPLGCGFYNLNSVSCYQSAALQLINSMTGLRDAIAGAKVDGNLYSDELTRVMQELLKHMRYGRSAIQASKLMKLVELVEIKAC